MTTTTISKLAKKKAVRIAPTPQPEWASPHVPQPPDVITNVKKSDILMQARAVAGLNASPELLAAVIIAQAADRLADKLIEAAAIGRYR